MKLYYHKTSGGAEYYCLDHIKDCEEGDLKTAVLRTDGDEFEVLTSNLHKKNIKVILN